MRPLDGIRVIDFTENLAGNLTTMYLASFGAEVIKIENPNKGLKTRKYEPLKDKQSLYFAYLSKGTKSLGIDISKEESKDIIENLIKNSDVICESNEPGYMEKFGLAYEDVKKINPEIIYSSQSYYGHTGPLKNTPGSSCTAQAYGVSMDMTGVHGGEPIKAGPPMGEHYSAGYAASGIVMALIRKKMDGYGQKLDVSLLDSLYSTIEAAAAAYSMNGEIQTRKGNFDPACAPYDTFQTNDGFVAVGVASEIQWQNFAKYVVNMPELVTHPIYSTNTGRCDDYLYNLRPILADHIINCSKYDIERLCRDYGIPSAEVMDIDGMIKHPHIAENNFLSEFNNENIASFVYPSLPIVLSETPALMENEIPFVGEDTEDILGSLGYDNDFIKTFRNEKAV
jgi:CoA:oxalate CoA-transferase